MARAIYLDYAAATPMDERVVTAMEPYFTANFYNPSALYLRAKAVSQDIGEARQTVARIIGAKTSEVIFTAGGTEANNLAVHGIMQQFPGSNVVVSAIEHESVLEPANGYDHKIAQVLPDGRVWLDDLIQKIDDNTVLVSVMYANNEIGTIQPLREIATVITTITKARRKAGNTVPLYFHTDAAQATAYVDMHASRIGVDLMTINGGKIYGPKQSGMLFVKTGTQLKPQILGGGQERSYRSGTENITGIIGFATALKLITERKKTESERLQKLQKLFFKELAKQHRTIVINGSLTHRLPNNVHITVPGTDNERLLMELDERGIMCAVGSACSASNDEPSHVLSAIGLTDEDARSSLRFTMGIHTTQKDIQHTVKVLAELVKSL
jgi:cysteine desulfurase